MKTKGEATREMIIMRASHVFNQRGYFGTSIADLVAETGLERGGIYNHFKNKDELALAAFDYAVALRGKWIRYQLEGVSHAADRLIAIAEVFLKLWKNPELPGGCPVLNTATEADDTHPALKAHAEAALRELEQMIGRIVERGVERGELNASANPFVVSTLMISSLEGGLMMSKLHDRSDYLVEVIRYLTDTINQELRL